MTDRRRRVREGYDDLASVYAEQRETDAGEDAPLADLADRLDADPRVLDAGCGDGRVVLERFEAAVGLDFSAAQLDLARGRAPLVQGDMTALPFAAGTFDAVTALYAVIHVPEDEHRRVYGEFARVLRPGGWLLLTVGEEAWSGRNDDWLDSGVAMEWSFPDLETSRGQLAAAGLSPVETWLVEDSLGGEFPFVLARKEG